MGGRFSKDEEDEAECARALGHQLEALSRAERGASLLALEERVQRADYLPSLEGRRGLKGESACVCRLHN